MTHKALHDLRQAASALGRDKARPLATFDGLLARTVAAVAHFCRQPAALLPAQRALLVVAGAHPGSPPDLQDLRAALGRLDEGLGRDAGGFSRLLESALRAGEVVDVPPIEVADVEEKLRPLAARLEQVARELLAVDDLSHALSVPADIPAACVLLDGAVRLLAAEQGQDDSALAKAAGRWLAERGLAPALSAVFARRRATARLVDDDVTIVRADGVARPFAMWVLAQRLGRNQRLEHAPDREALSVLLAAAGFVPLEVFDAALLWGDLAER